jgi:hypothetical protein
VVVAVLVVAALFDRIGGPTVNIASAGLAPQPMAAPESALSSSWFCAGVTDGGQPDIPGSVVIANDGSSAVSAQVTVVSSAGSSRTVTLGVPAHGRGVVAEKTGGPRGWVGAMVDVDGGAVAVAQEVQSALGRSYSPCATTGSQSWYFPSGSTLVNADTEISLLNPYPADSIVDLSFSTDQGVETPEDYQGLDVPPRSMISVDLRDHLRRRPQLAATVSVRTGSLVAWETGWTEPPASGAVILGTPAAANPLADPSAPISGLTVTLGAPSAGTSWVWSDGLAGNGVDERYVVYNPGSSTADVRLSLYLQQGQAEPFNLSVGGGQVVEVVSGQEARIPAGVPHSATLTSLNGVPVVAERTVAATPESAGGFPQSGLGGSLGMRVTADKWLVPATASGLPRVAWLVVLNPGSAAEKVELSALSEGHAVQLARVGGYQLGPIARLAIPLRSAVEYGSPLLVSSTGPLYVEYDFYGATGAGMSLGSAVPLP